MRRLWNAAAVLLMLAVAVAVLLLAPAWMPEREKPAANGGLRAVPVRVEAVSLRTQEVAIQAVGTSRARQAVTLFPAAAGEVIAVNFRAGERVEAGRVLLELDRREETLQLELAQVRLAEARRELERNERLGRAGGVAAVTLEAARTAARLAELELQRAEVALADRSVRAPFSGHIGLTDVDVGDRIAPDTVIATLDDRRELLVNFELPELFFGRVRPGDRLSLTAWTAEAPIAAAKVVHVGTRVDPVRRTFSVRAGVNNADDRLRPGMSFRVDLRLAGRQYPTVPEVSLQWGDQGSYVWAVREGRARRVPAIIVQRVAGHILVDAELAAGELVITEGVQSAREGAEVEILGGELG